MRYFDAQGAIPEPTVASEVRVHVVLSAARSLQALLSASSFSFPLCGTPPGEWTQEKAICFVRDQVIEFSHHTGSLDVTDLLMHFW